MPSPATPSSAQRLAASLLTALGLGLALWLALIKWRSLPCLGGGCDTVIQSRYGALFGVPVGVYGAALWTVLAAPLPSRLRWFAHVLLAFGAAAFMGIQFGVLRAFCPYCTIHAVAALAAWRWRQLRPAWWALALGAALAAGGYGLAQRTADLRAATAGRPAALAPGAGALYPFDGDATPAAAARPVLVLSLTCPACLDLLGAVSEAPWPAGGIGAALYVKSTPRDRELATVWLAACTETAGSTRRDRFTAVTAMLAAQRELITSDPDAAARWLAGLFQPSAAARQAAAQVLDRHAALVAASGVITTPWLLPPHGPARTRVTPADLWR